MQKDPNKYKEIDWKEISLKLPIFRKKDTEEERKVK